MKTLIRYGTALIAAALVACGGADTTGSEVFVAEMQRPKAAPGVVSGSILCADVSAATDAGGVGSCRSPFASLAQVPAASTTATVLDADAFMNWAQGRLPELFPGTPATLGAEGFVYRAYSTGNFIGVTTAEIGRSVGSAAQGGSEINAAVQRMADTVGSLHAGAASTAQAATELARLAQDQTTLLGHFRC